MMYNPQRVVSRVWRGVSNIKPQRLVAVQLAIAIALVIQAVAVVVVGTVYRVPIYMTHLTSDTLGSQLSGQAMVAPAVTVIAHVNVAYLLAALLLLTALIAALLATTFQRHYIKMLKDSWQPWRWVTLVIAGVITFALLAMLAGVRDVMTLAMLKAFVLVSSLGAVLLEQAVTKRTSGRLAVRILAAMTIIAGVLPWLVILAALAGATAFGSSAVAGYLWWLFGTLLAGGALLVGNAYLTLKRQGQWRNYAYGELWSVVLVAVIETAFVWQVFAAVLHP